MDLNEKGRIVRINPDVRLLVERLRTAFTNFDQNILRFAGCLCRVRHKEPGFRLLQVETLRRDRQNFIIWLPTSCVQTVDTLTATWTEARFPRV